MSILPFLVALGVFPSDLDLDEYPYELTEEAMRKLVLLTRRPIIQIKVTDVGIDEYLMFGPAKKQKDPTPMILIIQDIDKGGPAMLSLSPSSPIPIPEDKMSFGLNFLYEERVLVPDV